MMVSYDVYWEHLEKKMTVFWRDRIVFCNLVNEWPAVQWLLE